MAGVLAIDLGATSGRAVFVEVKNNALSMHEVNRFANKTIECYGYECWDIDHLVDRIIESIQSTQAKFDVASVGIDTWGVDFGLLGADGTLLMPPVQYRDEHVAGMVEEAQKTCVLQDLYAQTGNQIMAINTLFRLLDIQKHLPEVYGAATHLLMMPDLIAYLLTEKLACEKSIASTTQMFDMSKAEWNADLVTSLGLNAELLPSLVSEGTVVGHVSAKYGVSSIPVVSVLTHDTQSAFSCFDFASESCVCINSGTWSLIGTVLQKPLLNEVAFNNQFTNELGSQEAITFLKNCTGLFILEELRSELARTNNAMPFTFEEIQTFIDACSDEALIFDTDSPELAQKGNMLKKIACLVQDERVLSDYGLLFKSVYSSLAHKYAEVVAQLEGITQQEFKKVYLLGGGSKSGYLTQLSAQYLQKLVITGLYEASAVGNAVVQLKAMNLITSDSQAFQLINNTFELIACNPLTPNGAERE